MLPASICTAAHAQSKHSSSQTYLWTEMKGPTEQTVSSLFTISQTILFYSKLCPSNAGSNPPPVLQLSLSFAILVHTSILLPVAPQYHLSNDVMVFQLILHTLSATLCF